MRQTRRGDGLRSYRLAVLNLLKEIKDCVSCDLISDDEHKVLTEFEKLKEKGFSCIADAVDDKLFDHLLRWYSNVYSQQILEEKWRPMPGQGTLEDLMDRNTAVLQDAVDSYRQWKKAVKP